MIYRAVFILCGVLSVGLLLWLNITTAGGDGPALTNEQAGQLATGWSAIGRGWRIGLLYVALGIVLGLLLGGRIYALGNKFDYNNQLKKLTNERDRAHQNAHESFKERKMAVTRAQRRAEQFNYLANCKLQEAQRLTTLMEEKERKVCERLERAINKHENAELRRMHKLISADHRKLRVKELGRDKPFYDSGLKLP